MVAAGVPGRREYWKVNAEENRAWLDDVQGVLEVRVRLAREADDDVGGDRRVRDAFAHLVEDREEPLRPIGAAHGLEHPVGTGLQRHVQAAA
jgi:hypothetical protein